jgi:AhpD family alkylhydroperoxidase
MQPRLKYTQLSPEGYARLRDLEHFLNTGTRIEAPLREYVRLRASLMNGCHYCIHLHTEELRKLGEPEEKIENLGGWHNSALWTPRERAALGWAEALTNIQDGHAPDSIYDEVRQQFSEVDTVDLTYSISAINAWNRIAISLGTRANEA